jgi:transcriptional regulator with XRE-family HTH domain
MFYDNLKSICKEKHTSPSAVALAVGISKSNATKWKAGQTPKMDNLVAMAEHLQVSIWDLIDKEKPATISDDGLNEINLIFNQLSPENRSKLLELAHLYLASERSNEERQ